MRPWIRVVPLVALLVNCSKNTLASGPRCPVGGEFFDIGQTNPTNPCQACQITGDAGQWISANEGTDCDAGSICSGGVCKVGCYFNGTYYQASGVDAGGNCYGCVPSKSTHSANTPYAIGDYCSDDNSVCTTNGFLGQEPKDLLVCSCSGGECVPGADPHVVEGNSCCAPWICCPYGDGGQGVPGVCRDGPCP